MTHDFLCNNCGRIIDDLRLIKWREGGHVIRWWICADCWRKIYHAEPDIEPDIEPDLLLPQRWMATDGSPKSVSTRSLPDAAHTHAHTHSLSFNEGAETE